MNPGHRDEIDRAIDEVLASIPHAEPRRVSAVSVRRGMVEEQRLRVPVWLALAAVLVVGFVVVLRSPRFVEEAPKVATLPAAAPSPPTSASSSLGPGSSFGAERSGRTNARVAGRLGAAGPAFEMVSEREGQLPPLLIAGIEVPPALVTARLESDSIHFPSLDIAPLSVPTLSIDSDHKQ